MDGFVNAIKSGFTNYVNFSGRSGIAEYWFWVVFVFLGSVVASIIDTALTGGLLYIVFGLATFIPSLSAAVRRLHDTGKSGWWLLIAFVPIVGFIVLIFFLIQKSKA